MPSRLQSCSTRALASPSQHSRSATYLGPGNPSNNKQSKNILHVYQHHHTFVQTQTITTIRTYKLSYDRCKTALHKINFNKGFERSSTLVSVYSIHANMQTCTNLHSDWLFGLWLRMLLWLMPLSCASETMRSYQLQSEDHWKEPWKTGRIQKACCCLLTAFKPLVGPRVDSSGTWRSGQCDLQVAGFQ